MSGSQATAPAWEPPAPAAQVPNDHDLFVGDIIDQLRRDRQEKSRRYRNLPYFEHLGSEEVFEALDRVRQANLLQMQLKMQKDCSYLQHMDDMSLEGRNAASVRKRVQEGKVQGGFRQIQNGSQIVVCGCLDCQLRLGNKQFTSSFHYEEAKEALVKKAQSCKLTFSGAAWHGKLMLTIHLVNEALDDMGHFGTALHVAVLRGEVELVRFFVGRMDLSAAWGGVTALDLAVSRGFEEGGEVLLQHNAELKHFEHETILDAVDRGSPLLLRAILQQLGFRSGEPLGQAIVEEINRRGSDGNAPLHVACTMPDREAIIRILIAAGAEPNIENAEGLTALDCCVEAANQGAFRALKQATGGSAKCSKHSASMKSLKAAVVANCLFVVKQVHLRSEEDRPASKKGDKPRQDLGEMLHLAVGGMNASDGMARYLLSQGADVNYLHQDGTSVLDACLQRNVVNESVLGKQARLSKFLEHTILWAAAQGLAGVVRYKISCARQGSGDIINKKQGISGLNALHLAARGGYPEVVKVLLKSNANIQELTSDGLTALDLACASFASSQGAAALDQRWNFALVVEALLARGAKLKVSSNDVYLQQLKVTAQGIAEASKKELQQRKDREGAKTEARVQVRRNREEHDDAIRQVEREVRACVKEEEKKADAYKESERLAKKVVDARDVLQASLRGESEKLLDTLPSKYYQIRIEVLKKKIKEKEQQIEDALRQMDSAEEDYLYLLRKRMRDLRLKYHPDKIVDRKPSPEDYKLYDRLNKAFHVLSTREERDTYLEIADHVGWLESHGDEAEARLVERSLYDVDAQKKAKAEKRDANAPPQKEHVERAKKKLQERREEDTSDKSAGERLRALTLGTPNKCKAPVLVAQRFAERSERCWIDIEWVCKCASTSAERIEYEIRVQSIDKGVDDWVEVYHGWESNVTDLGPFPVGAYEFMVRARNSIGWGEWSDVSVVTLEDPRWEKQLKKEAEQQVQREQGKAVQNLLQQLIDEVNELKSESKLTIHRATKLLYHLQVEVRKARVLRASIAKPGVIKDAEKSIHLLERWRDRKEAFTEWKMSLLDMKAHLVRDAESPSECVVSDDSSGRPSLQHDLLKFLGQDEHYFGSLAPNIRNLIVQTLLGLDSKPLYKRLSAALKEMILQVLRRGIELGKATAPLTTSEEGKEKEKPDKPRTIFTRHQIEQLQKVADRYTAAPCHQPQASGPASLVEPVLPSSEGRDRTSLNDVDIDAAVEEEPLSDVNEQPKGAAANSVVDDGQLASKSSSSRPGEKRARTVHISGLPSREQVTRTELINALRDFADVDGARLGSTDALVRFTTAEEAAAAMTALERGEITVKRAILNGRLASTDQLTEEALRKATGQSPPKERPQASQQQRQLQNQQQAQQQSPAHAALPLGQQQQQPVGQPLQQSPSSQSKSLLHPAASLQQQQQRPPLSQSQQPALQQKVQKQQKQPPVLQDLPKPVSPAAQSRSQYPGVPRVAVPQAIISTPKTQQVAPLQEAADSAAPHLASSSLSSQVAEVPPSPQSDTKDKMPKLCRDQLVNPDEHNASLFQCTVCSGLAWQPKLTMCCETVFCGQCLDNWLLTSSTCPQCNATITARDGSTGSCKEQKVKKLGRDSQGANAVLWRVYGGMRIRCASPGCDWIGEVATYEEHLAVCQAEASNPRKPSLQCSVADQERVAPGIAASLAQAPAALIGGTHTIVCDSCSADNSTLHVRAGDSVHVLQVAPNGWTFGRMVAGSAHLQEGWFPTYCLHTPGQQIQQRPPPPPQWSPPPRTPPAGLMQVSRCFEATEDSQLSVQEGELVIVQQRNCRGWTLVVRNSPQGAEKREGWVPDWLLQQPA